MRTILILILLGAGLVFGAGTMSGIADLQEDRQSRIEEVLNDR